MEVKEFEKLKNFTNDNLDKIRDTIYKSILLKQKDPHHFIMMGNYFGVFKDPKITNKLEMVKDDYKNFDCLDLPFKSCSFEFSPNAYFSKMENKIKIIFGLMVNEVSPRKLEISNLNLEIKNSKFVINAFTQTHDFNKLDFYESGDFGGAPIFLNWCLRELQQPKVFGSFNKRLMIRRDREKNKEVLKVVVVKSKCENLIKDNDLHQAIDWTHRFEVMGHWRKINGIGKDREYVRNVDGFTWVVPHIRGPDSKPLIKKSRLVWPNPENRPNL